jgi:hypothetical protein
MPIGLGVHRESSVFDHGGLQGAGTPAARRQKSWIWGANGMRIAAFLALAPALPQIDNGNIKKW